MQETLHIAPKNRSYYAPQHRWNKCYNFTIIIVRLSSHSFSCCFL